MTEPATSSYASHRALIDPGPYAALISDLPADVAIVCRALHGLLIHEAWIERQGSNPTAFAGQSRDTLPVARRLEQLLMIPDRRHRSCAAWLRNDDRPVHCAGQPRARSARARQDRDLGMG
ncbi:MULTISPECIES: hypothetical protein [Bradyrhizobium]|uniref:hypothetical protein n=1 Tax=Bradyrhizobium TaxID=374 RepID=UPI0013A54A7D|nr:hypothetical protein [Bradyrhizobium diazoefficiens]QJS41031.1 hypothetical protein DI395_27065 [Bradyrhizobium diazoefficiens]